MARPERTLSYGDTAGQDEGFVAPYLVLAMECERPLALPERLSIAEVDRVVIGRGEGRHHRRRSDAGVATLEITVPDGWMSTVHAEIVRSAGGWLIRDCGSKNGTYVASARVDERHAADGDLIEVGSTLLLFRDSVTRMTREPADAVAGFPGSGGAATLSLPFFRTLSALERFAPSDVPIVLLGETGTGKEVTARLIHERSRRPGDFVAVNCGALPATLIEGELFGHKKGAFSGADRDRPGLVRAADRGTLFLDEIGELPASAQTVLLRVLQEGEVLPLGATRPIPVDLRVIAATHVDLSAAVESGAFRADLYARLCGYAATLPPLRERREDIGVLVATLLSRMLGERAGAIRFDRDAARALFSYDWPLNVRELEQALRAAATLAEDGRIRLVHLPAAVREGPRTATADPDDELRAALTRAFTEHCGNVSAVAREMGKARVQIRRWCKRFGLDPDRFRR